MGVILYYGDHETVTPALCKRTIIYEDMLIEDSGKCEFFYVNYV